MPRATQVTLLDTLDNLAATRTVADQLLSQAANVSVGHRLWPPSVPHKLSIRRALRCISTSTGRRPFSLPLPRSMHFACYGSTTFPGPCRYMLAPSTHPT